MVQETNASDHELIIAIVTAGVGLVVIAIMVYLAAKMMTMIERRRLRREHEERWRRNQNWTFPQLMKKAKESDYEDS